ncbi:DNA helicase-2/ATP-dependent DNA helicase PcrA [Methylobacter tundripaludum]|uniref:DNA 3'-5' helicase II n=1 Tax=Methylobacter tundripaludum TaxID=173365 RepID=A0A2S6HCB5_9GAMM|nr:UvrD-helicase domain-containing protein [Methylobacter tundripaludum]PPK75043.1 DNA helicase-2/ATP-dependent DNA helicase PcrA [Methylobacter tundripaludum]
MESLQLVDDNNVDNHVDDKINAYLSLDKPISFFLFAGAGSGKTGSLVKALKRLRKDSGERLRLQGQRVGVITYTNAACDEINHRLDFDPLVEVSTIHSFVWSLIGGFNIDIKQWLRITLPNEIADLEEKQRKGRAGQASLDRAKSIEIKQKRLIGLDGIKQFTYNPNGDNRGRDSLNHSEVIKIGADFLTNKPLMQTILINKFPILLIDESQDTNKHLMEAFLKVQHQQSERFCLGLFGDTMQRIYSDGKMDLGINLPPEWATPVKKMNHRCPRRIVKLINKIRSTVDAQEQSPRTDKEEGVVRLFILPNETADKLAAEHKIKQRMTTVASDPLWNSVDDVKTLILEHHMAALRMGFLEMFEPLYQIDRLKTALLDGSLPGLRLFSQQVLPLVKAKQNGDEFAVAAIVRNSSPLLSKAVLKELGEDQLSQLKKAREAVEQLMVLWSNNAEPRFLDILQCVSQTGLFEIPESLRPIAFRSEAEQKDAEQSSDEEDTNPILDVWDKSLLTPFAQINPYVDYVNGSAPFDTHQGVKGLEFPRVLVVMDDAEARGFMFDYDKLFGAKDKTKTDIEKERNGDDTGINRTRRLFYVTCSRAVNSLAIVAYTSDPNKVRDNIVRDGWFEGCEVEILT